MDVKELARKSLRGESQEKLRDRFPAQQPDTLAQRAGCTRRLHAGRGDMVRLTRDALKASARFIQTQGRPLEEARYSHAFGSASPKPVLEALAMFQNPDGGFGHALEPDLRAPEGSALCTSIAFQIFRELSTPPDSPMVRRGVEMWNNSERHTC